MLNAEKKFLFVTTSSFATNPRLVKELKKASELVTCHVVYFNSSDWSKTFNTEIQNQLQSVLFHSININRFNLLYLFSKLSNKVFKKLRFLHDFEFFNSVSISDRTILLIIHLFYLRCIFKFNLVIGHNIGVFFPITLLFSKNKKVVLDIEDFHPGERSNDSDGYTKCVQVFRNTLANASFVTYASPLIGEYSLKLIPDFPIIKSALINNCFNASDFYFKENLGNKISFVWFSQNITAARGLEWIIPLLFEHKVNVHLTLIGNLYQNFYDEFLIKYTEVLTILPPFPQDELHAKLCDFDIGLALEQVTSDINRDICLTNKIFAYAQSGLYILATATRGQSAFLNEHSILGQLCNSDENTLEMTLDTLIKNIFEIRKIKNERFEYAKKLSWENESKKLVDIWRELLK